MKKTNLPIDCFQCEHFFVTWDAKNPRGCKAFGFKTPKLPSIVVFENSGEECLKFTPKEHAQNPSKKTDWIA
jgi:hypothetical protein